mgnify:CR=1 FL=1
MQKTIIRNEDVLPVLIWDGNCGFCKYWKIRWENMAKDTLNFCTIEEAKLAFPELEQNQLQKSIHLIEENGEVCFGAKAVFKSFEVMGKNESLIRLYESSPCFRTSCEKIYELVARNRRELLKLTQLLFGKDPKKLKPYWIIYLLLLLALLLSAVYFL